MGQSQRPGLVGLSDTIGFLRNEANLRVRTIIKNVGMMLANSDGNGRALEASPDARSEPDPARMASSLLGFAPLTPTGA